MIELYFPELQDLWFREYFLADEATMSYNHAWGGTITFPEQEWKSWYERWLIQHDNKHFYRYLKDTETRDFVGEIAYHYIYRLLEEYRETRNITVFHSREEADALFSLPAETEA